MTYYTKTSNTTVATKLNAKTLEAAKTEAWALVLEQFVSCSVYAKEKYCEDIRLSRRVVNCITGEDLGWIDGL